MGKDAQMNNVRDVEALSDKLISYLRARLGNPAIDFASPLTRLQGGYETSTYRFELDGASDELSGPLVLRLYPQFYGTRNAIWESTVQNVLAGEGYPVAQVHVVCTDMSILGGAFFIMDHLPGQLFGKAYQDYWARPMRNCTASIQALSARRYMTRVSPNMTTDSPAGLIG
jgi:aminoglycoside phosphotransferase (APT) family kinase protein